MCTIKQRQLISGRIYFMLKLTSRYFLIYPNFNISPMPRFTKKTQDIYAPARRDWQICHLFIANKPRGSRLIVKANNSD